MDARVLARSGAAPPQAPRMTLPKPFSGLDRICQAALRGTLALDGGMTADNFHKQGQCSANEVVRPCSCPASDKLARSAKTEEHAMLQ